MKIGNVIKDKNGRMGTIIEIQKGMCEHFYNIKWYGGKQNFKVCYFSNCELDPVNNQLKKYIIPFIERSKLDNDTKQDVISFLIKRSEN